MLSLYNTLTRGLEPVKPTGSDVVAIYSCGPTVYRDAHIGNLRSYLMADWIRRVIEAQGLVVIGRRYPLRRLPDSLRRHQRDLCLIAAGYGPHIPGGR